MKNIFLIGFMGVGKTTVGKELAKLLDYSFLDTDEFLEDNEGQSIAAIFELKGEEFFRIKESQLILSLKRNNKKVISVGGGLPCYNDNMNKLLDLGIVIYLKSSSDELLNRLKNNTSTRPLLKMKTDLELKFYINETLKSREKYFEKAHHTIAIGEKSPLILAEKIKELVIIQ